MASESLTDKNYWHKNFGGIDLFEFGNTPCHRYLKKYLEYDHRKKCIEIGAFPGANLGYLAKKYGYKPTALDFVDNVDFIKSNMAHNNIECEVIKTDFTKWNPAEKYDVVCSHGFIEHFTNYEDVIDKHIMLLKKNGILILTVPYLKYFQHWIRKRLYRPETYKKIIESHNTKIMDIEELTRILFENHKLSRLFSGFIREMTIWFNPTPDIIKSDKLHVYYRYKKIEAIVNIFRISNRLISPEILVVAKKDF